MPNKRAGESRQPSEGRIENLVELLLKADKQRIEYMPQFAVPLLEMPPVYHEAEQFLAE